MTMVTETEKLASEPRLEPKGLAGWLLVPLVSLLLSLPLTLVSVWNDLSTLHGFLNPEYTPALTPEFIQVWKPYVGYRVVLGASLVALMAIALPMFFMKKQRTPAVMLTLFGLLAASSIAESLWVGIIHGENAALASPAIEGEVNTRMLRSIIFVFVWGSYFMVSHRVRNTFTR